MRLHLGGHLAWYDPQKRAWLDVPLAQPQPLRVVLDQLGVPAAEIAVATVNGVAVELERARVADADSVQVFPPVGGGATK